MNLRKMIKDNGIKLVSKDAVDSIKKHLEEEVAFICKQGGIFRDHAGRKLLRAEDVKLAILSKR